MTRDEAVKALSKAAKALTKAEQAVAALDVERTQLIETIDNRSKAARLSVLDRKREVELATRAVLAPEKATVETTTTAQPRFTGTA